jgi:hypothetical protein
METIRPRGFAITVIIAPSLIAREAPLVPLNVYPEGEAFAQALIAGATTKEP